MISRPVSIYSASTTIISMTIWPKIYYKMAASGAKFPSSNKCLLHRPFGSDLKILRLRVVHTNQYNNNKRKYIKICTSISKKIEFLVGAQMFCCCYRSLTIVRHLSDNITILTTLSYLWSQLQANCIADP